MVFSLGSHNFPLTLAPKQQSFTVPARRKYDSYHIDKNASLTLLLLKTISTTFIPIDLQQTEHEMQRKCCFLLVN